ncbi:hypothetical protein RUND412_002142 [Rhizina undulata]
MSNAYGRNNSSSPSERDLCRFSISSASSSEFSTDSRTVSCCSSSSTASSSPPLLNSLLPDAMVIDTPIAKIEELDDDDGLGNVPLLQSPTDGSEPSLKRGRGRPRKHPLPPVGALQKVTKGRSKTGCITCRRRKKKCDEAKPECQNCIKNAVICEGYPERSLWQSGRQKHEPKTPMALMRMTELPILLDGVETLVDRQLLDHFVHNVSRILTLFNDKNNPFQEIILPLAIQNRGLMHSLLCLSGSHLCNTEPSYEMAQRHHFGMAMQFLRQDPAITGESQIPGENTIATTLILCLQSICEGETGGQYRPHLDAARHMLQTSSQKDSPFSQFLIEFFTYHDVVNSVTILGRRPLLLMENYTLPAFILQPDAGALIGVLDGLFGYMSKITLLRDEIRKRKANKLHPRVNYEMLSQAVAIDSEIRQWVPAQVPGSHRYIAAQLYRQCTWVYLFRTIQPSVANKKTEDAVDEGLEYLRHLPEHSGTQSILLMPLFLLGCAAFSHRQRPEISQRFEGLHEWSGLGNIRPAREVVRKVWDYMDAGDEDMSWDWERIIQNMGYDFLVT